MTKWFINLIIDNKLYRNKVLCQKFAICQLYKFKREFKLEKLSNLF